jgi:uncharacterized OB-fold protein
METKTNQEPTPEPTAFEEYMAHQKKLETADIYDRCKRCGKITESFYPYCVRCQTETGKGDRITFDGVPEPRPTE